MALRRISEKVLVKSVPGIQATDISIAAGSSGADEGRVVFYTERPSIPDEYRILDGRCFALTSTMTHSREGTKFSPVEVGVLPSGDIVAATVNFESGFQRNIRLYKYDGATGALLATVNAGTIVLGEQMRLTVNPSTGFTAAQGWQKTHDGAEVRFMFDSSLGSITASGYQNNGDPFVVLSPIVWSPAIDRVVTVVKAAASTLVPGDFIATHQPGTAIGTLFTQTNATAAASSSYRDGPASIAFDSTAVEYIAVSQFQTNNLTFEHDIQVFKFSMPLDTSPTLATPATTLVSSLPPDASHTGLQAGLDLVLLSDQSLLFALESLDYDGVAAVPNAQLLLADSALSSVQTIDLGAPGKVRICERAGRIYVLHQEMTPTSSNVYLSTYYDDSQSLPPHAIRITNILDGSNSFSSSKTVSIEVGEASASKFLFSETQTTNPGDTSHPGFVTTLASTFVFGSKGLKTIYAWYTNPTTSLFPNFATIFVSPEELTWTYVMRPGNNIITPAVSTQEGEKAINFVSNSAADIFFYENNGVLAPVFGNFIHANPGNSAINIPMEAGKGYIAVLNSSFMNPVRTYTVTGEAWAD